MPRLSENAISFFGAGGHKHDGVSSTLISTDKYSLFDFNPGYLGAQSRVTIQQANQTALEEWVMSIVNTKVLAPAGLDLAPGLLSGKSIRANTITATELQANTITASEIATGTITANELSSNIILVNNVIRSNNYNGTIAANGAITASGNAGWAITSFGSAEFANTSIRGALIANSVATPGIDINSDGSISSTNFNVTATGNVSAVNATITGAINASSGSFTGKITVPGTQTQFGTNINDAANYQGIKIGGIAGEWKNAWVERNDGSVYFNAQNPAGTNRFYMDSTDSLLSMGNGAFTVTNAGVLTATSGSISGSVTIGGTAASTVVANAALGGSAAQPGSVNGLVTSIDGDKITTGTINLNNLNVRTGTTGARINLDSGGLYAYNAAGTQTVRIGSDGSATFTGSVSGSSISGSAISTISTPFTGFSYDQYRLNIYDTAKIRAEMRYQCDANGDNANYTSFVDINNVGSAIDGAVINVTSSTGSNTHIRAGIIDTNVSVTSVNIYGTIRATTSTGSSTPIHQNGSGQALTRSTSKRALKYDIKDFNEIGLIDKLVTRTYKWKKPEDIEETEYQKYLRENTIDIGFIAEEVAEIENGRLANFDDEEREIPSFWKYLDIIALLVAEVKDLRKRVASLEDEV